LTGTIDQEEEKEIDPLWGEDGRPDHYYEDYSLKQVTKVSKSKSQDMIQTLEGVFADVF